MDVVSELVRIAVERAEIVKRDALPPENSVRLDA
jgi:hypothetical protein